MLLVTFEILPEKQHLSKKEAVSSQMKQSNCSGNNLLQRLVAAELNKGQSCDHPLDSEIMGRLLGGKALQSSVYS